MGRGLLGWMTWPVLHPASRAGATVAPRFGDRDIECEQRRGYAVTMSFSMTRVHGIARKSMERATGSARLEATFPQLLSPRNRHAQA